MTQPFSRTLRSLDGDSAGSWRLARVPIVVIAGLWLAWFFAIPVQVSVTADDARIEATQISHPVQAPVEGSVQRVALKLGARVRAGDVLIELDATEQRRALATRRAEGHAAELERTALDARVRAVRYALATEARANERHVEEAELLEREGQSLAELGQEARVRKEWLGREGVLAKLEVLDGVREDREQQGRALALGAAARRVRADGEADAADRAELLAELERQAAVLDGKRLVVGAAIAALELEIERRVIRSPTDGRLGDMMALTAGAVVGVGVTLASVVPEGSLRIVAEFPATRALGRIRPGQTAEMTLEAYPWTAYGALPARVHEVAREVNAGKLRVELAIEGALLGGAVLEHGLSGGVRVSVERAVPAALLWRAVGRPLRARGAQSR